MSTAGDTFYIMLVWAQHSLASRPSRQECCMKISTQNTLGTHTSLTWHCMSSTMMLISWYDRSTVIQLLTDHGWTYRQMDVLTDTEKPDRQTDVLPGCPRDVWMDTQMYDPYPQTYRQHMDIPKDVLTTYGYTDTCTYGCADAKSTKKCTCRQPDIPRCLKTFHTPPNYIYEMLQVSLVKVNCLQLKELEHKA